MILRPIEVGQFEGLPPRLGPNLEMMNRELAETMADYLGCSVDEIHLSDDASCRVADSRVEWFYHEAIEAAIGNPANYVRLPPSSPQ